MKTIIILLSLFTLTTNADLDLSKIEKFNNQIEKECSKHKLSKEKYFKDNMGVRCSLILQGLMRFESNHLQTYKYNNPFNFRGGEGMKSIKKEWKELGVVGYKKRFLVFNTENDSVRFAVNRFYKFERYKTINQIVYGGKYKSPVDGKIKVFDGYTLTKKDRPNYFKYLSKYYNDNLQKQEK